jgi:hypothetical protein
VERSHRVHGGARGHWVVKAAESQRRAAQASGANLESVVEVASAAVARQAADRSICSGVMGIMVARREEGRRATGCDCRYPELRRRRREAGANGRGADKRHGNRLGSNLPCAGEAKSRCRQKASIQGCPAVAPACCTRCSTLQGTTVIRAHYWWMDQVERY